MLASVASLASHGTAAQAVGAKPPTDPSFYVMGTTAADWYNAGYVQGVSDHNNGNIDSTMILDFGGQQSNDNGTIEPKTNNVFYSWATVESLAETFGGGYYLGTGPNDTTSILTLAVGTNNSAYWVNSAGGAEFGAAVQAVSNWFTSEGEASQVYTEGGNDMEPGYDSYSPTASWISGWTSSVAILLLNYGSADGCPLSTHSNGTCNNGWTQDDIWLVSWGDPPSYAAPEIYIQDQADQWGQIRYWKYMQFVGPLDEYPLNTNTFNSTQAWTQLWDQSGGVGQSYSLEISNGDGS